MHHIHCIGIGGIGMSGLALLALQRGYHVTGSDKKYSNTIAMLRRKGIRCDVGHAPEAVRGADTVVYSTSIGKNNTEYRAARARGCTLMHRSEMVCHLSAGARSVAITGAHGKTTTSALATMIFHAAGLDPTALIGGHMASFDSDAVCGGGEWFIFEADESDGSFLRYRPDIAVILTIDDEHFDYFGNRASMCAAYRRFAGEVSEKGVLVYNSDDRELCGIAATARCRKVTIGFRGMPDLKPCDVTLGATQSEFHCRYRHRMLSGPFVLNVPGRHTVLNACAAIAVAKEAGISDAAIRRGLALYAGTKRRFERHVTDEGDMIIEDYAHHPTEIRAVLETCALSGRRMICVFQPHRYTRTRDLFRDFTRCFDMADHVILTDIYAASESPIKGIDSPALCRAMKQRAAGPVEYLRKQDIPSRIRRIRKPGDIVMLLGAGDINDLAPLLCRTKREHDERQCLNGSMS